MHLPPGILALLPAQLESKPGATILVEVGRHRGVLIWTQIEIDRLAKGVARYHIKCGARQ